MSQTTTLIACPTCDLLQHARVLNARERANCPRCGQLLRKGSGDSLQANLALAITVMILLAIANLFPIMSLEIEGQHRATTVIEGVVALWNGARIETAILVLAVTIVIPLLRALAVVAVTIPLMLNRSPARFARLLRFVTNMTPWGMTEVYLLGALVAFIKLGDLANVEPGPALFAFGCLSVISALSTSHLDTAAIWSSR
ncbi:MAG: paraquat-inducible protein A [Gammaproteobacteria bacterium]|jgi:paraquat-inducible protein A